MGWEGSDIATVEQLVAGALYAPAAVRAAFVASKGIIRTANLINPELIIGANSAVYSPGPVPQVITAVPRSLGTTIHEIGHAIDFGQAAAASRPAGLTTLIQAGHAALVASGMGSDDTSVDYRYAALNTTEYFAEFFRIWTYEKAGIPTAYAGSTSPTSSPFQDPTTELAILCADTTTRNGIRDGLAQLCGFANNASASWTVPYGAVRQSEQMLSTAAENAYLARSRRPSIAYDRYSAISPRPRLVHLRADMVAGFAGTQPADGAISTWTDMSWHAALATSRSVPSATIANASGGLAAGVTLASPLAIATDSWQARTVRLEFTRTTSGAQDILVLGTVGAATSKVIRFTSSNTVEIVGSTGGGTLNTVAASSATTVTSGQRCQILASWDLIDGSAYCRLALTVTNLTSSPNATPSSPALNPAIPSGLAAEAATGVTSLLTISATGLTWHCIAIVTGQHQDAST